MKKTILTTLALACALTFGGAIVASAQDSGALLDALVRKKVLTSQEAEDVRADLIQENAASNAGKLQLSNSVTSLKLYGDVRLRYQYDDVQKQLAASKNDIHDTQQDRERVRLRLGADFTLNGGFFGGVGLQTAQASDSANQTVDSSSDGAAGFGNYNIYISKAFVGWANDWFTVIGGKQNNPFYTTDLVWDPDINPVGVVEKIDLIKGFEALSSNTGDIRCEGPFNLSLVAGQLAFCDNTEANTSAWNSKGKLLFATHDNATDCWLFNTQLIGSAKVTSGVKVTVAPGYMTYTAGNTSGINNSVPFNSTSTSGTLTNINGTAFSGQRDLSIITAPGDVSFDLCGLKTKVLWDFAYNTAGGKRAVDILGLTGTGTTTVKSANGVSCTFPVASHNSRDDIAWLAGVQVGENKKAGDWSVLANFRQTGIAAVDPNLNDSDFAAGYLNTQGVKTGIAYNLTDFCIAAITYYDAWNLRGNLYGAQATGGNAIAAANSVQVLQVDLNVKF